LIIGAANDRLFAGSGGYHMPRKVITTLNRDGTDKMGMTILALKDPDEAIVSGSLLTVESNHICILKSRGAILQVYETGQYSLTTPDKPITGIFVQAMWTGGTPWQYEIIYLSRSKLLVHCEGVATSAEMAEVSYTVDFYIHIDSPDDAVKLITHMPFAGHVINTAEVAAYARPAIEQALNQIIQNTKLEQINNSMTKLLEAVKGHLDDFLAVYGISLNDLKVLVLPKDERMRELIALQAVGLTPIEACRFYLAFEMGKRGLNAAANAAIGAPFNIGGNLMTTYPLDDAMRPQPQRTGETG
jgi:membrane protease subunit (stomatin/prohibitin family)